MTAIVRFTSLYGSCSLSLARCSLLEVDGFKILLDCGWDERFDPLLLEPLSKIASQVDAVLLSHSSIHYSGALPYALSKLGLHAPIYATLPIVRMSHLALYDAFLSQNDEQQFELFTLDDIDTCFEHCIQLKFQQHLMLTGKGSGLIITPYSAGYSLGATVWKVKKHTDELLYAVDFNHRKEKHLNASALGHLQRPSHLILGASQFLSKHATTKSSVSIAVSTALSAWKEGYSVLIPTDTSGRILELALQLDEELENQKSNGTHSGSVCIVHHVAFNVLEFARSMIEWMSDSVGNKFDETRTNPFSLKHVTVCHSMKELDALPQPQILLASGVSLESGFAKELFVEFVEMEDKMVLWADRVDDMSLAKQVIELSRNESDEKSQKLVDIVIKRKQLLEGNELKEFMESEMKKKNEKRVSRRRRRTATTTRKRARIFNENEMEFSELDDEIQEIGSESDEDSIVDEESGEYGMNDGDKDGESGGLEGGMSKDVVRNEVLMNDVSFVSSMYPFYDRMKLWDDYGEIVDVRQFQIGEDPGGNDEEHSEDELDGINAGFGDGEKKETLKNENVVEFMPTKYVVEKKQVEIRCKVVVTDSFGLADGRAMKEIVSLVAPRRLIVAYGSEEESVAVKEWAESERGLMLKQSEVYVPRNNEPVDATSDTSVYRVTLHDSLLENVAWRRMGDVYAAHVTAAISLEKESGSIGLEYSGVDGEKDDELNKNKFIMERSGDRSGHAAIFLGDLRISELKDALKKEIEMKSEFAGGYLCVENQETDAVVLVKKTGPGEVLVDAAFSQEYFKLRDILYDQFAIL